MRRPTCRILPRQVKAIAADPNYSNVSVVFEPLTKLATPVPVDLVWTSQNYHDLHNFPSWMSWLSTRSVFDALKPGGFYLVLDHSAPAGSGARGYQDLA